MFAESYSESPRQPSPWDTPSHPLWTTFANGADREPASDDAAVHGGNIALRALIPEDDLHGHIEYKLRLPAQPSVDRMARLTSQLKWRLLEGGGEAIYELGVCDNGLLLGISHSEMTASLKTLQTMAANLGAIVRITREEIIMGHVVPDNTPRYPSAQSVVSCSREPRIPGALRRTPLAHNIIASLPVLPKGCSLSPSSSQYTSRPSSRSSRIEQTSFFPEIMLSFLSTEQAALSVTTDTAHLASFNTKTGRLAAKQRSGNRQRKTIMQGQIPAGPPHLNCEGNGVPASTGTVPDGNEQQFRCEIESDDGDCLFPGSLDDFAGGIQQEFTQPSDTALSIDNVIIHAVSASPPYEPAGGVTEHTASNQGQTGITDLAISAEDNVHLALRRLTRKQWKQDKQERGRRAVLTANNARTAFKCNGTTASMNTCTRCIVRARHERNMINVNSNNATLLSHSDLAESMAEDDPSCECVHVRASAIIENPNDKYLDGIGSLFSIASLWTVDSLRRSVSMSTPVGVEVTHSISLDQARQSKVDTEMQAESARLRDFPAATEVEREAECLRKVSKPMRKEYLCTQQKQHQATPAKTVPVGAILPAAFKIPNIDGKKNYIATRHAEDAGGRYAVECAVFYPDLVAHHAQSAEDDEDGAEELDECQTADNVRGESGSSIIFSSANSTASNDGSDSTVSTSSLNTPGDFPSFLASPKHANATSAVNTANASRPPPRYIDWSGVMSQIEREARLDGRPDTTDSRETRAA